MKISIDSAVIEFQSVQAQLTKTTLIRHKAPRGDHEEREFFISIEPSGVFTTKTFELRLLGEETREIAITFNPTAMKSERVEGSISVIDEFGKKLATCTLNALRQSFIRATPSSIDAGWILPEKRKECFCALKT